MSIINYAFHVNNHKRFVLVYYRKHACKSCQRYLSKKFPLSCDDLIYGIRVIAFLLIGFAIRRIVFIYCDQVKFLLFLLKILVGRILKLPVRMILFMPSFLSCKYSFNMSIASSLHSSLFFSSLSLILQKVFVAHNLHGKSITDPFIKYRFRWTYYNAFLLSTFGVFSVCPFK